MLTRRDLLRLSGSAAALAMLPTPALALASPSRATRLFFDPSEIDRIRRTAASPMMAPILDEWRLAGLQPVRDTLASVPGSRALFTDFRGGLSRLTEQALLQILEPTARREAVLLKSIDVYLDESVWDYFYAGDRPMGLQLAPEATERLLFVREVLGDAIGSDREARLLDAVAEKGCMPCAVALSGMEDPDTGRDWRTDEEVMPPYNVDMTGWPEILRETNLRAVPAAGLGIGALALMGRDPRADEWLDQASRNARAVLDLFEPDGTYNEGVGYTDYTLRTMFVFFEAHQRVAGADWAEQFNPEGVVRYILAMQAGLKPDGTPDVVNFSDSWGTTSYGVPAWIARRLDGEASRVAQFAVERASQFRHYQDVLWTDPDRQLEFPPESYLNARLDNDHVICRTGWAADDAVLGFRGGGPANHEHADRNSFLFKIHGERLLNDHYGAAYGWADPKWLLRQTEAHNALLIDGQGHQYHDGKQGTNPSQAEARITSFQNEGDRVWWTSDATPAYALVNDTLQRVRRTVLFAKPDIIILLDEVDASSSVTPSIRFFPDNHDGAAFVRAGGSRFTIERPHATLTGHTAARDPLALATDRLDLDVDLGVYPFVEITGSPAERHELVTVLVARPTGETPPEVEIVPGAAGWRIVAGEVRASIRTVVNRTPEVTWL